MNYNTDGWAALAALVVIFAFAFVVIALAIYILTAIFMMQTFQKMGIAGWKAWIPVLNTWIWFKQGNLPGVLALLLLLPVFEFGQNNEPLQDLYSSVVSAAGLAIWVLTAVATARIAPKFGKPKEYWLLTFIPPVLFGLLASKKAVYRG